MCCVWVLRWRGVGFRVRDCTIWRDGVYLRDQQDLVSRLKIGINGITVWVISYRGYQPTY